MCVFVESCDCLVLTVLKHWVGPFELSFIYLVDSKDKAFCGCIATMMMTIKQ